VGCAVPAYGSVGSDDRSGDDETGACEPSGLFGAREDWQFNACMSVASVGSWIVYADSFKKAADRLVEHVARERGDLDFFILPIMFLYRHSLELQLKDLVLLSGALLGCDADKSLDDHRLTPLRDALRPTSPSSSLSM